ncbi:MAG: hypothetical protein AAGD92_06400 [Pseudomonadota bacterium]
MTRNWGIPAKNAQRAVSNAKTVKPLMTLLVSVIFGVIGASVAVISFAEARGLLTGLFHGMSLIGAVIAAGFGCWTYIWLARPRFAAQFSGEGDGFSSLLRFYAQAAVALFAVLIIAWTSQLLTPQIVTVLILCLAGGAGAAAAFQTVLAFVPYYD